MAASSSSSSSNPHDSYPYSGKWEYDVFLCFRGADTRRGITSHLKAALSDKQIKVFIDDMLEKTESIDELISVLQRSALSVVIFSENFADSSWCLDEVATISQSMVEFGHRVLPVFYEVDPSDVSEDSGSYAAAIEQKHGASKSLEDRKRWMDALTAVANCAGHTSQAIKIDAELVKAVVKDVLKTLEGMSSRVMSNRLVGMDARISEVGQLLAMDVDDFRIIGLCGMGGVGKTTLAKACYQRFVFSEKEIKHHFVQDISEKLQKQSGIDGMVQELYSKLLSENDLDYQNLDISYRRDRLSRLRVFIVLDNVETVSQLEQLLLGDTNLFGPGSRIILTSRDRRVLEKAGACIYDVNCLEPHDSLQLFGMHAFGQLVPPDDWSKLSNEVVSYCKGNPLAIEVLGSALSRRKKSYWNSLLSELGKIPKLGIHNVLRRSYDMLETHQKEVFLDIACFFTSRMPKSLLIASLSTDIRVDRVVEDLIDKSLLSCASFDNNIKGFEMVKVHDLLREMAWRIVNEEPKLGNRTRLKNFDEIGKLTIQKARRFNCFNIMKAKDKHTIFFEGGRTTKGIVLNLSKVREMMHLEGNAFEGMTSLKYLSFTNSKNEYGASKVNVPYGGLDSLPDSLRWLVWDGFPSKYIPSRFSPENLVLLAMPHSLALERCWKVQQPKLVNLVCLDLSHCINLVAIPNLLMSRNLEFLVLRGCKRLIELPSHVQDLDKLILLDLSDCSTLQILPAKLNSKFLKVFQLSNCPKVTRCPETNSRELLSLNLEETPIAHLPSVIHNLKQGGFLRLHGKHITNFPVVSTSLKLFRLCHTAIREMNCYDGDDHQQQGSLPTFVQLELVGNHQLKSLSRNIWRMVSQMLILDDCPLIESLPEISQPVNDLILLDITRCRNLKSFPASINKMKSLQNLRFADTNIRSLPACILELDQLSSLYLYSNKSLEFVPSNIHKLAKLSYFHLSGCLRIQSLPELPPNLLILVVSGCTSLQALPSNIAGLRWKELYFEDCPQLDTNLPKEIVHNFPKHATSTLHPQCVLQYSGSEIPEWFAYKSLNCRNNLCMMVQLPPPNSTSKQLMKRIAFGVVCSSDIGFVEISITCDCNIGTTNVASWSSPAFGFGLTQSDYVYMWYEKNLLGKTKEVIQKDAESWYERYAGRSVSFRFSLQPSKSEKKKADPDKVKSIKFSLQPSKSEKKKAGLDKVKSIKIKKYSFQAI